MKKLLIVFVLLSFLSCADNGSRSEELLKEVMLVHDSIMPWMDEMHELSESLIIVDTLDSLRVQEPKVEDLKLDLENASEAMMLWMSEFKPEKFKDNRDSLNQYLQLEKEKISAVGLEMKSSIEEAKNYLNEE